MQFLTIDLSDLKISPLNVRQHGDKSGDDLKDSIKSKGLLQPLLVRPNCEGYEIIVGQRRFHACQSLAKEGETMESLPCVVMDKHDDATVIEVSLAENIHRLPMDMIDQFKAFTRLMKQGRTVSDIAVEFSVSERLVEQRLALANLYDPILNAFRKGNINTTDLQTLTLATKRQQKAWWKLVNSEEDYAPTGRRLRAWLFGGETIPTCHALFDLAEYKGAIQSDLFGEDSYFRDIEQFWKLQSNAIAAQMENYRADGWSNVYLLETGQHFHQWDYVKCSKEDGGAVLIGCSHDGEVTIHEGFVSQNDYKRRLTDQAQLSGKAKEKRPEITKAMQNYVALHKHAAVRATLLTKPNIALRLSVAHLIAGSGLWSISIEPQKANNQAIETSINECPAQADLEEEASAIRELLGFEDDLSITNHGQDWDQKGRDLSAIFSTLLALSDAQIQRIQTFLMAETLQAHTGMVEALGELMEVNMREYWQPDDCFFDLMRDKEAINCMVADIAGEQAAASNLTATAKVQKQIIRDCLDGTRNAQTKHWHPTYMAFPMRSYTGRGGIDAIDQYSAIANIITH